LAVITALETELEPFTAGPDFDASDMIFYDPRDDGSMRLTKAGYDLLKDKYPHWSTELTGPMTMKNHTYLVSVSVSPYYIHGKLLTTFDSNLGVLMKMVSGDFHQLERLNPRT
jgi:hypothetical protein